MKRAAWQRRLRYLYIRFIRLRGHPREIARGIAAGVFAGCYPLFGLQTLIGVAIAAAIRGNKIMAAAATWISNPLTYVPIYAFNFQVGRWLLRQPMDLQIFTTADSFREWSSLGLDITQSLMVGSTAVGLGLGLISYILSLSLIQRIRQNKRRSQSSPPLPKA
ncbi:MAG: DUF2062 domain-containing protein [Cyanobacteria bacterium P01_A01_bin.105]